MDRFYFYFIRFAVDMDSGEFTQIGNQTDRNLDLSVRVKAFQTATLFDTCTVDIELYYLTDSITFIVCAADPSADVTDVVGVLMSYVFTPDNVGTISIAGREPE